MIRGISHACYRVSDLDAAIGFYVDALGCRHAFDFTRDDGTRFGAYVYIGSRTFIELFQRDLSQPAPTGASPYQHLCLEVDDMERTIGELRGRGVEVSDPKLGADGNPQAWITDPDGNRIELHELRPDGWQIKALERLETGE